MATINGIINELKEIAPYLNATPQTVVKNTVPLTGLCLRVEDGAVAPVVYIDKYLDDAFSDVEAAKIIKMIYHSHGFDVQLNIFHDHDYVLDHLAIGLQKDDPHVDFITKPSDFDGIMQYLYIKDIAPSGQFSVKITKELIDPLGITIDEAWEHAKKHTASDIEIKSMTEVLSDITGDTPLIEDLPMYILSNSSRIQGSAAIINKEYIKEWAQKHNIDSFVIIFSSIHECILIPAEFAPDLDYITDMINSVNSEQVDPIEQLATRAYYMTLKDVA